MRAKLVLVKFRFVWSPIWNAFIMRCLVIKLPSMCTRDTLGIGISNRVLSVYLSVGTVYILVDPSSALRN